MNRKHWIALAVCASVLAFSFFVTRGGGDDSESTSQPQPTTTAVTGSREVTESSVEEKELTAEEELEAEQAEVASQYPELVSLAEQFAILFAPTGYQDTASAYEQRITPLTTPRFVEENGRPDVGEGENESLTNLRMRENFVVFDTTLNPDAPTIVEMAENGQSATVRVNIIRSSTGWYTYNGQCPSGRVETITVDDSGAQEQRCLEVWPQKYEFVAHWLLTESGWRADEQVSWSDER